MFNRHLKFNMFKVKLLISPVTIAPLTVNGKWNPLVALCSTQADIFTIPHTGQAYLCLKACVLALPSTWINVPLDITSLSYFPYFSAQTFSYGQNFF